MKKLHKHAAGIDLGSRKIYIGIEGKDVASFETFTADFIKAAEYLKQNDIATVAMEATGVYWLVLYDILVEAGIDVWLVDGRQTKQVPGRKTDVKDCQWIQQLHSYGLLNRCFVAEGVLKTLRSYQRMREDHIRSSSTHIQHMQKALIEMNIRLPEVLSQIQGKSGLSMVKAILDGERNPDKLILLCNSSVRKTKSNQILKALEGFYTPTGLFALKQAYDAYLFYQKQIEDCDNEISKTLVLLNPVDASGKPLKRKPIRHHSPNIKHFGNHLLHLFNGKDATTLSGITDYSWFQIYTEVGSDLSKWPTEKHFTSWLGLSPCQHNSGKRNRNARKGRPKAGQIFRQIAQSLLISKKIALGAFGRRIRARKGPGIAIKAVARKLAIQFWRLMVKGYDYVERGVEHYEQLLLQRRHIAFQRLAKELKIEIAI